MVETRPNNQLVFQIIRTDASSHPVSQAFIDYLRHKIETKRANERGIIRRLSKERPQEEVRRFQREEYMLFAGLRELAERFMIEKYQRLGLPSENQPVFSKPFYNVQVNEAATERGRNRPFTGISQVNIDILDRDIFDELRTLAHETSHEATARVYKVYIVLGHCGKKGERVIYQITATKSQIGLSRRPALAKAEHKRNTNLVYLQGLEHGAAIADSVSILRRAKESKLLDFIENPAAFLRNLLQIGFFDFQQLAVAEAVEQYEESEESKDTLPYLQKMNYLHS
jgi:hypothetical protein